MWSKAQSEFAAIISPLCKPNRQAQAYADDSRTVEMGQANVAQMSFAAGEERERYYVHTSLSFQIPNIAS